LILLGHSHPMAVAMQSSDVTAQTCSVTWVPVMLVSGQMTPMLPSGQMTPMLASGQMTPMMPVMQGGHTAPPGQWCPAKPGFESNVSTMLPSVDCSGACSDAGSESDGDEDVAEACAELIAQLKAGGEARTAAIEALEGSIDELAFDAAACRVVQAALELADEDIAVSLAHELKGHVRAAIHSPHANHVVQKMIDVLPPCHTTFVVEEILGAAAEIARHRFGSRVLCRLVLRQPRDSAVHLINELLEDATEFCRHSFAHYVIEAILDNGSPANIHTIALSLSSDIVRSAKNRSGTHVVERALLRCSLADRSDMMMELFQSADTLVALVENQFGCHVAKSLVRTPGPHLRQALNFFEFAKPMLQQTKYGRRVLEEFNQVEP